MIMKTYLHNQQPNPFTRGLEELLALRGNVTRIVIVTGMMPDDFNQPTLHHCSISGHQISLLKEGKLDENRMPLSGPIHFTNVGRRFARQFHKVGWVGMILDVYPGDVLEARILPGSVWFPEYDIEDWFHLKNKAGQPKTKKLLMDYLGFAL